MDDEGDQETKKENGGCSPLVNFVFFPPNGIFNYFGGSVTKSMEEVKEVERSWTEKKGNTSVNVGGQGRGESGAECWDGGGTRKVGRRFRGRVEGRRGEYGRRGKLKAA